ncbi:hypothetical protein [Aureibacillus halotolerans]|uniref:Uncharacterized protein n=1 Tax=Aureibacillus halotolerans TaxID=1508390 RepID=A0A4R6UCV2_9BACI|nr:hypothetical protein [Aureibacillus halotolerans]TDQ42963.1 hypothetical protein EV213_101394 [Aureibacillus halotolerans]
MARSKAKKVRSKRIREGRRDPELNRSPYAAADLTTRKTKTKKGVMYKCKHQNHHSHRGSDDSFLLFLCL